MASALAGLIGGKLAGLGWDKATLMWRFKDDMDGMRRTMVRLQAFMHDADKRESQDGDRREMVRVWMKDFKSAAYDVEDLLDNFEAIELIKQNQPKIKLFFSSCNPLLIQWTMAHKMKIVKEALENIAEAGDHQLKLVSDNTPMWAKGDTDRATIAWTSGDIDTGMVGRDTEKENIMKQLLESKAEEHISIIPIVGLGGLGKTTLAQAIFSDRRSKIFDLRVWVYVSKKFDLIRIGKQILLSVDRSIDSGTSEKYMPPQNGDLHTITEQLENILPTKRYLIILDDMWEEGDKNLETLKLMLRHGGKGSKIIITTRMRSVMEKLDVGVLASQGIIRPVRETDWINLNYLSDDVCWNVIRQMAFRQDAEVHGFEDIGRQIAKKCVGLPLLARSLGFVLSQPQYKSIEAWEYIRDRRVVLDMREDQGTLQSLMLSYYYMPFEFKLCFTYCAVFPKGFGIASNHLIQQWRALGYIHHQIDGDNCINYLLGMSFLRILKSSQSAPEHAEATNKLTMHDLVHDLARLILDNELLILDASEPMTPCKVDRHYGRHMHLINYQTKALKEYPGKIRSLHFTECSGILLQQSSFSKSKYLRVLDISGCSVKGKPPPSNILLPSSIQHLRMLRYFDASGVPIPALPKSLHNLQNMQTLILCNCALETLPDNIGSLLINLSYLDLSDNRGLKRLPRSFGELSAVSFLKLSGCSKLDKLPESIDKLECLRHLDMSGCCALQKLPDKFGSLPKLLFLNLSNCSKLFKLPDSVNLKYLEHLNLSSCHELQNLPQYLGNLEKLKFLNLSDCYKLQVLPESICQLQHLRDLDLSDCHDLKELPECFGNLSELHALNLTSCSKLRTLPGSFGDLLKLKHLNLSYCVRFENLPSSFYNLKLQILHMSNLQSIQGSLDGIGSMTSLNLFEFSTKNWNSEASSIWSRLGLADKTIHDVDEVDYGLCSSIVSLGKLTCRHLEVRQLENVKHPEDAERTKLRDNPDLRQLKLKWSGPIFKWHRAGLLENKRDAEVLENLVPPRTLERFELSGYRSWNFPSWMVDISSYLPYLDSITLISLPCDSLPPFGRLPNLRLLYLWSIPNIKRIGKEFYGEEGACKKLRVIKLYDLSKLEEWWTTRSGDEEDEFLIPNLHQLEVHGCPLLKFLPCPPKSMYWDLHFSSRVLPVHGFGRLSTSTLPFRAEIVSPFSPDLWGGLQHLTTLEELKINVIAVSPLPEAPPSFPSLRYLYLSFSNLEILPEWLGQLTTLEVLHINECWKATSLPESIRNLTSLKRLDIMNSPKLVERCKGKDAHKICHIPEVIFGTRRYTFDKKGDGTLVPVQGERVEGRL